MLIGYDIWVYFRLCACEFSPKGQHCLLDSSLLVNSANIFHVNPSGRIDFCQKVLIAGVQPVRLDMGQHFYFSLCVFSCLKQITQHFETSSGKKTVLEEDQNLKRKAPLKVWKIMFFFPCVHNKTSWKQSYKKGLNPYSSDMRDLTRFLFCLKHVYSAAHVAGKRQTWYF